MHDHQHAAAVLILMSQMCMHCLIAASLGLDLRRLSRTGGRAWHTLGKKRKFARLAPCTKIRMEAEAAARTCCPKSMPSA